MWPVVTIMDSAERKSVFRLNHYTWWSWECYVAFIMVHLWQQKKIDTKF